VVSFNASLAAYAFQEDHPIIGLLPRPFCSAMLDSHHHTADELLLRPAAQSKQMLVVRGREKSEQARAMRARVRCV
jgi:hypothetical protein